MADYKLRVDVDEAELTKKLKRAVEKAFGEITLGGGGGGGTNPIGMLQKEFQKITKQTTQDFNIQKELILLRSKERKSLEEVIRTRQVEQKLLAKENALIRLSGARQNQTYRNILGLFGGMLGGGRAAGAAGGAIDYGIAQWQGRKRRQKVEREKELALENNIKDRMKRAGLNSPLADSLGKLLPKKKEENKAQRMMGDISKMWKKSKLGKTTGKIASKAGTPVKIAGVVAGLAAGGGLAKMIIDASPLLQAMLKLLNVGIMLILRPIGDFIGFMLRPLLIEFVKKVAVPMYRTGFQAAKTWGTELGKSLLKLVTQPDKFITDYLVNPIGSFFEKLPIWIGAAIAKLGVFLNPLIQDRQGEYKKIDLWSGMMLDQIDSKYTGFLDKLLTGEEYDNLCPRVGSVFGSSGTSSGTRTGIFGATGGWSNNGTCPVHPWVTTNEENTSATDKNTEATNKQTSVFEQYMAAGYKSGHKKVKEDVWGSMVDPRVAAMMEENKKKYPEWFPGTPEYKEKQNMLSLKGQHTYANDNDEWTGAFDRVGKDALLKEAQRAAGVYGSFANPGFETGGYTKINPATGKVYTSAERKEGLDINTETSAVMQELYDQLGSPQRGTVDGQKNIFTGSLSWLGQTGNEIPDEGEMQELIIEPLDNINKNFMDGTNIAEEFVKDLQSQGALIKDHKYQELNAAQASKIAGTGIKSEMECAEDQIESAVEAGGKIADGLWALWDKVDRALNRMRVYTNSKGRRPYKRIATAALQDLGVKSYVQDEEDNRWLITWPKTDSQPARSATMNLSAAAVVKYQEYAAQGSLSMIKLARGGIINEPILGMGQKSGRHYLMGEAGPETITPGANTSTGTSGGNTFNITINAKDVGDIERQLKPTILRILKESTSRAGIV